MIDHHRMKTGCRTAVAIVNVGHHRYRVIATNRYGTKSSRQQAFIATSPPSVNEIRRGLGLDVLDSSVIAEAERITLKAAEAAAFRSSLLALGKVASRASVFLFLLSIGLENGNLDCEQGPLYMAAKPVFTEAAAVLARAGRAGVGPHAAIVAELAGAQTRINGLKSFIAQNHVVSECEGPNKVALNTIQALEPALTAANARLEVQAILKDYYERNRETRTNQYGFRSESDAAVAYRTCREYRTGNECTSIATIFPGNDTPQVTRHELAAITNGGKPVELHWVVEGSRARPGWYRDRPECAGKTGGRTGKQCDEYPFRSTREGGPGASLRPANQLDNSRHGQHLRRFYTTCGLQHQDTRFLVVPLPATVAMPTRYACNARRA